MRSSYQLYILLSVWTCLSQGGESGGVDTSTVLDWLNKESRVLTEHRKNLETYLTRKGIPLGRSILQRNLSSAAIHSNRPRFAVSTEENDLHCRVSLDKVPIGRVAVAPCRCVGTNEVSARYLTFSFFGVV
jgi:hypothetical protein